MAPIIVNRKRRVMVKVEEKDMNVIDDLYLKQPTPSTDEGRELTGRVPEHPFEQDETDNQYDSPQTFHPNILPPTEFMALGMYAG